MQAVGCVTKCMLRVHAQMMAIDYAMGFSSPPMVIPIANLVSYGHLCIASFAYSKLPIVSCAYYGIHALSLYLTLNM